MYKDNIFGISIAYVFDDHNKSKDGLFPIKIRVIHNRKPSYYLTGKRLSKDDWGKLATSRIPELMRIRKNIKDSFDLIVRCVEELSLAGNFSFQSLNVRLGRESAGTVDSYYKAKVATAIKDKRIGTAKVDEAALTAFQKYGGANIPLERVTPEWLKKMEINMLEDGVSMTTIGIRMRSLRTIMSMIKQDEVIPESNYPFGKSKYQIRNTEGTKKALSISQIHKFVTYETDNDVDRFYLDMWFFIYLCNGINVADLVELKHKDIVDGEIRYIRNKTARSSRTIRPIIATVTPEMNRIIERWGTDPIPDNHLFFLMEHSTDPIVKNDRIKNLVQIINRRTKKVGMELGLGNITTYTARHSFATVLKRSGANIAYISESLGHTDLKTTEKYLASFESEERKKNAILLTMFPEAKKV